MIVVVATLLIIALGVTSYISFKQLQATASRDLIKNILDSANYETQMLEQYVERNAQPVADLAELYKKYDYSSDHEKYMEFAARLSGIYKFTLGFDDGRSFTSKASKSFPNGVGLTDKYDPQTRPWYKLGKSVSELTLSDVFFTKQGAPLLGRYFLLKVVFYWRMYVWPTFR